mgnify:CR=1 FL=1
MKFESLSSYTAQQIDEISELFQRTFSDSEGEKEGRLIGDLTRAFMLSTNPEDLYGFFAIDKGKAVAGIFFTRLTFNGETSAFILAPVAVHTDYQGQGIGQELINFGLAKLREDGVELAITYGDINFYAKVGFQQISEDIIRAPLHLSYPEGWLAQSLSGKPLVPIAGNTSCVKELDDPAYW